MHFFRRIANGNAPQGARTGSDPRAATELRQSLVRYRTGDRRSEVSRDLVLSDVKTFPPGRATVLDIGCGRGFDGDVLAQRAIASRTRQGLRPCNPSVKLVSGFRVQVSLLRASDHRHRP